MQRRKDPTLEDRVLELIDSRLEANKRELARAYDLLGDKLLDNKKRIKSTSIPTISGGRPESNRRKFLNPSGNYLVNFI